MKRPMKHDLPIEETVSAKTLGGTGKQAAEKLLDKGSAVTEKLQAEGGSVTEKLQAGSDAAAKKLQARNHAAAGSLRAADRAAAKQLSGKEAALPEKARMSMRLIRLMRLSYMQKSKGVFDKRLKQYRKVKSFLQLLIRFVNAFDNKTVYRK